MARMGANSSAANYDYTCTCHLGSQACLIERLGLGGVSITTVATARPMRLSFILALFTLIREWLCTRCVAVDDQSSMKKGGTN